MRALEVRAYDGARTSLVLVERPRPQPAADEVLIQVVASPINPSDLLFLEDRHGVHKPLPAIPGYFGSGIVVAAGTSMLARMLVGQRVTFGADHPQSGAWAEYALVKALSCAPLLPRIGTAHAALLLLNPITAWGLVDEARQGRHRAIVQTAAASEVGRWVLRLSRAAGLPLICVVRRAEQVAQLRAEGADYVLNSSSPDFDQALHSLSHRLGATIAFDAVGGRLMERLLLAMPSSSRLLLYGLLAEEAYSIPPERMIFERLRVEGFYMLEWMQRRGYLQTLRGFMAIQKLAAEVHPNVRACFPLEEAWQALQLYRREMGAGKVLLMPGLKRSG